MPHYLLSWTSPNDRLLDVSLRFTAPVDDPRLLLPAWRPGRYLIQDYAANVREWSAGESRVWKEGKSAWRVAARAGQTVQLTYRYYAGVLDAGSSFLDPEEAYVNGTNLFMLVEGLREEEHLLTVAAPADWPVHCQLPRAEEPWPGPAAGAGSVTLRARDYDDLVDSPLIAAERTTRHTFRESGAAIHLVFHGDEGTDTERFVEPVRAIVKTQGALFGGIPLEEYRFLVHLRDRWHGVEHASSCSIVADRASLAGAEAGDEAYDHFLSIVSHEFFHVWNVKRILPARFVPYDYWSETPTRLLWAMEGATSYYGDLTLARAGLWSAERYLRHLEQAITTLEALPAQRHLSLAQASFDGWLSDPAAMHDHPNAWFSFYTKGEVVSALLDLTIRRASRGERSLDDVFRFLWAQYPTRGAGLEEDAVERAVARLADVGDFFTRWVDGTEPLPYAETFAAAGIEFESAVREPLRAALGAKVRMVEGRLMVEAAIRGGAGMTAGLLHGDEIVAVDGARVTSEAALGQAMRSVRVGGSAEVVVARAGRLQSLQVEGRPDPRPKITLRLARPEELPNGWLGRAE